MPGLGTPPFPPFLSLFVLSLSVIVYTSVHLPIQSPPPGRQKERDECEEDERGCDKERTRGRWAPRARAILCRFRSCSRENASAGVLWNNIITSDRQFKNCRNWKISDAAGGI
ncbi:hypothetical protein GGX14DRAFT_405733 [Mycena pura]|uniref:Uncharacterized protein n=1 Tax=Mycena pura TaxID=153505 RepID=A0AAD6Y642_9AGAR|nr:hypothetical protein GGX14DRAFT_405733 [Mycena pura]